MKKALGQPFEELKAAAGGQLQLPSDLLEDAQRTLEGLFIKRIDVTVSR